MKCGIVIGHYNQPDVLRLNIAAIRHFAGDIPVVVSDDCSPGFGHVPPIASPFQTVLSISEEFPDVHVWPNVARIGHAGGDMAAIWKGIVWANGLGLDVIFKLSQRFIFTCHGWATESAKELIASGNAIIGRGCVNHGFDIRTEAIGLVVSEWYREDILGHLTQRATHTYCEHALWNTVRDRLGNRMLPWKLLADGREKRSEHYLFRASSTPEQYAALAEKLHVRLAAPIPTCDSSQFPDYVQG